MGEGCGCEICLLYGLAAVAASKGMDSHLYGKNSTKTAFKELSQIICIIALEGPSWKKIQSAIPAVLVESST